MNIGFIGLGNMGFPMARNIMKHGYSLYVYDVSEEALNQICEIGAVRLNSSAEVAQKADITIMMLPEPKYTEQAILGENGFIFGARAGTILIDMSSGSQLATREIARELNKCGVDMMDAPVSGSAKTIASGEMSIMVSGKKESLERCQPIFECMGTEIFHVSEEVGVGHAIKSINNMLFGVNIAALVEGLVLGKKAGIDPEILLQVINSSSGMSYASKVKAPAFLIKRKFAPSDGGFKSKLEYKDINIATSMARELGVPTPVAQMAQDYYFKMILKNMGTVDLTGITLLVEEYAGVSLDS